MKYLKYGIMSIIIIIIIMIIVLLKIIKMDYDDGEIAVEQSEIIVDLQRTITDVSVRDYYYDVKKIIKSYYNALVSLNETENDIVVYPADDAEKESEVENNEVSITDIIEEEKESKRTALYNRLDKEYIEKNGITLDNIQEKLGNYKDLEVIIDNMYYVDASETVKVYFIQGKAIEKESKQKNDFSMMISTDLKNMTYQITPSGYEYDVQEGKELIININEIENRKYNKYKYAGVDNETYCKDLIKDYKNRLMYDLESAYNILDEEYRKAKFSNFEEFEDFVKNNYNRLITINIKNYQKDILDDYIQYVLEDRQGREYIFRETATMKYSAILDTYTIDIPEFIQKYQQANIQEKVVLNINKFMMAINDKDYKYVYSILADSFKNKNFPTLESFETYAKQSFFERNEFEYGKFDSEGDTYYTYNVTISDSTGQNTNTVSKTFIIRLNEGTDFEISFNI